jgi:hypothetical protein
MSFWVESMDADQKGIFGERRTEIEHTKNISLTKLHIDEFWKSNPWMDCNRGGFLDVTEKSPFQRRY